MSAIRRRCSRCSGSAIEVWPIHTVQFSNHTGYGAWRGAVFDAALIRDVVDGHRRARRARRMRLRAVRLHGVGRDRRGDPGLRRRGQAGQPGRAILLRSGDRRRRPRRVRAAGYPRVHARARDRGRRHRHAEPVRARAAHRPDRDDGRRHARRRGRPACARSADRRRHLAADAGDAARRDRYPRLRPRVLLPRAHARACRSP